MALLNMGEISFGLGMIADEGRLGDLLRQPCRLDLGTPTVGQGSSHAESRNARTGCLGA